MPFCPAGFAFPEAAGFLGIALAGEPFLVAALFCVGGLSAL